MGFERRLLLLGVLCTLLLGSSAALAMVAVLNARSDMAALTAVNRALGAQQDADMMHDALHADLLSGVVATSGPERQAAYDDASDHRARATADFRTLERVLGRFADRNPQVEITRANFDRYARWVMAALRTGTLEDGTESESVAEALRAAQEVESQMAWLTRHVETLATSVTQESREDSEQIQRLCLVLAVVAVSSMGLTFRGIRRQVRSTLQIRDAAVAEMTAVGAAAAEQSARHEFKNRLHDALDMVDDEPQVYDVVRRTLQVTALDQPVELLLADSSRAHLKLAVSHPDSGGPGCPVESPWECVAVRRQQTVVFDSSEQVNACPKLRDRPTGPCSAVCVPVGFMGRALGVLHTTAPVDDPLTERDVHNLKVLATEGGTRIGTLRALARTQLQAATDGLTGLPNRRTVEDSARELFRGPGASSAVVAMVDLDHFKAINDTFGHDAGDRALRLFAQTIRASLRPEDLVGRYGGEEFVVVLPACTTDQAVGILERVQEALALKLTDGSAPQFTASFGVAAVGPGGSLESAVSHADAALLRAKTEGRNRVVVSGAPAPV